LKYKNFVLIKVYIQVIPLKWCDDMVFRKETKEDMKYYGKKKIILGIGLVIFGFVLWASSSVTALQTNLNWPTAFIVLGILAILKGLYFYQK